MSGQSAVQLPDSGNLLIPAVRDALRRLGDPGELLVLINDPQRHTDTPSVLRILAKIISPEQIKVLVAAGSHTFTHTHTSEFERSISPGLHFADFAWHNARSPDLTAIGSPGESLWRCHPWLLSGLPILAIGSVEPHYFAGFTGAHKTCTVGCASYDDLERNHAHAMSGNCRPCMLEGNPVYEGIGDMLKQLQHRSPVAAVNVVQAGRTILGAAGGDPIETLRELVPLARHTFVRTIPRPVDALIAEVAGPLGASFYQADKGVKNNEWALRDGGTLILEAPCPDGIGQDAFMDILRQASTYERALAMVTRRGYRLGDHKAVRLRYLTDPACRGVRVFLVSEGISDDDARLLGFTKSSCRREALAMAGLSKQEAQIIHVHDAGNNVTSPEASPQLCF